MFLRVLNHSTNKIRNIHETQPHYEVDSQQAVDALQHFVEKAKEHEFPNSFIIEHIRQNFGISETNLPSNVLKLLEQ